MNLKFWRISWLVLLAILIGWLLWQALAPLGQLIYHSDFSKENYFIEKLLPAERVKEERIIIAEPVYIAVFTTRPFDKANLIINFSQPTPALAIGLERDKANWRYDFRAVKEGTMSANLEFNLRLGERRRGQYTFIISAPNLAQQNRPLIIKDVTVKLSDPTLFNLISRWFKQL